VTHSSLSHNNGRLLAAQFVHGAREHENVITRHYVNVTERSLTQ